MNVLGGLGAADPGHKIEKTKDKRRGEEDEIQDGGMDWKEEEAGVVLFTSRHASDLQVR